MSDKLIPKKGVVVGTYTWRARLQPVLIVALPGLLAGLAWIPQAKSWWEGLGGLIIGAGIPALLAEFGRDKGKRKEKALFEAWGGKPTTRFLRHREAENAVLLERIHRKLQELLPDVRIPTSKEQVEDRVHADQVYDACVAHLRERTRDRKRFRILFDENSSYGFRRNLWGMKPLGITVAVLGTVALGLLVALRGVDSFLSSPTALIAGALNLLLLAVWLIVVKPSWVRSQAEAYAKQLLASCEEL